MKTLAAALLPAFIVAGAAPALAQISQADPMNDPASIVALQIENDAFSIPGTDRYYTSGERLGYVTPTGDIPAPLASLGHAVFGAGSQRIEIDLQQEIFTPADTQVYNPNPDDLPYSGDIALRGTIIQDTPGTRSLLGASIGVVGPAALGQSVQNGFHDIIGDTSNKGWRYQLHNEPTLDFSGARIWRFNLASYDNGALEVQALPQLSGQLGNTEIDTQAGAILRVGSGLDSDYGPAVMSPQMSGSDAYTPTQPIVWYVFGGAAGRLVAHEISVQGNDFQSSRGVALTPYQADMEVGAAFIVYGVRVTATEIFETPEFHHEAPAFQYGSIAISARF
jgi:lipid A 3-O-deacylase